MKNPPADRPSDVSAAIRAAFADSYEPPIRAGAANADPLLAAATAIHRENSAINNALRLLASA